MIEGIWSGGVIGMLSDGLNEASLRHRVIANNLANLNTPGFKRSHVPFGSVLREAAEFLQPVSAHPRHLPGRAREAMPGVVRDTGTSMRSDGNNVDLDREMAELAMNQLYYQALVQRLSGRLGSAGYVINGGRR